MKKETKVSDVAYELSDTLCQLGLLENYFSCLALEGKLHGQHFVLHSLFAEKGIVNAMDVLNKTRKEIQELTDQLCDTDTVITSEKEVS